MFLGAEGGSREGYRGHNISLRKARPQDSELLALIEKAALVE